MSDQDTQPQEPEINEHGLVIGADADFGAILQMQRAIWAKQAEQMAEEDAERRADEAVVKSAAKRKGKAS